MKTKVVLISVIFLYLSTPTFCQIAIKEIEKKAEPEVQKPLTYDSLMDYTYSNDILHNYQYIGLKVFLPRCMKVQEPSKHKQQANTGGFYKGFYSLRPSFLKLDKPVNYYGRICDSVITFQYNPTFYENGSGFASTKEYDASRVDFHTDCNSLGGKYFTVIDALNRDSLIEIKNRMNSPLSNEKLKERNIYCHYIREFTQSHDLGFVLKNDATGDTLYYMGALYDFVFVPFFVKQKEMFESKTFIASLLRSPRNEYPPFKDIITDKEVKIEQGSKWKCEVALLENSKVHNNFTGPRDWSIYYVLKNGNQTIAIGRSSFDYYTKTNPDTGFASTYNYCSFIIDDVFFKMEREKELKQAELIANRKRSEQLKIENEKSKKEAHRQYCINTFGLLNGGLIAQGKIKIGMTTKMCVVAWGTPFDKFKTTTASRTTESWYYGWKRSLHFVDGTLVRIDE